jgi:hypothetical protein
VRAVDGLDRFLVEAPVPDGANDADDLDRNIRLPNPTDATPDGLAIQREATRKSLVHDRDSPPSLIVAGIEGAPSGQRDPHRLEIVRRDASQIGIDRGGIRAIVGPERAPEHRAAHRELGNGRRRRHAGDRSYFFDHPVEEGR